MEQGIVGIFMGEGTDSLQRATQRDDRDDQCPGYDAVLAEAKCRPQQR